MSTIPDPACTGGLGVLHLGTSTNVHSAPIYPSKIPPGDCKSPHPASSASPPRSLKLNRIAEVRKSQGISERSMCKRLNIDLRELQELEDPKRDLTLSELARVQCALDVPLVDLIEDNHSLARPIHERAKLVRIMKTVAAIQESPLGTRPKRMAAMLREQLIELMPELATVGSWPQYGSRRGAASIARVLEQEISMSQIPMKD